MTTNSLLCSIHKENLIERLDSNKLTPLCLSCQAEIEFPEDLARFKEAERKRKQTSKSIARYIELTFHVLGMVIKFAIAGSITIAVFSVMVYIFIGIATSLIASQFVSKTAAATISIVVTGVVVIGGLLYMLIRELSWKDFLPESEFSPERVAPTLEAAKARVSIRYRTGTFHLEQFHKNLRQDFLRRTSKIDTIDKLDGVVFEEFIGSYFTRTGYKVKTTKASGDDGVDLIILKDGIKTAVQCKRYSGNVGVSAIQEVYAGKDIYGCDAAIVLTNSYFTNPAKAAAKKLGIRLWDRDLLIAELSETQEDMGWEDFMQSYTNLAPHEEQKAKVIALRESQPKPESPPERKIEYSRTTLIKEAPQIERISKNAKFTQFEQCPHCGTINKIDRAKRSAARCGQCKQPFEVNILATARIKQ